MPWSGAGTFNRIFSWVADKAASINITASRMDTDTNDIVANGLGNALTRDGQGVATANLPMANFRHTGVGNGVLRNDYTALGQVEDGLVNWAVAAGTADVITVGFTPAVTVLVDGQLVFARAFAANATTTPTLQLNATTAHTITRAGGGAVSANDIPGALAECVFRYNLANTRWELLNPATSVPAANSITSAMIQAAAIIYSKIQNVTNGRFLGNFSGGAAAPSEYSLGANLSVSGTVLNISFIPMVGSGTNVVAKTLTNTTLSVTADSFTVGDASGNYSTVVLNSASVNLGSSGGLNQLASGLTITANKEYHIWAVSKADGSVPGIMVSDQATANGTFLTQLAAIAGTYTKYGHVGGTFTAAGSAQLMGIQQIGKECSYIIGLAQTTLSPLLASGINGSTYSLTAPTMVSVSLTNKIPTTASKGRFMPSLNYKAGGAGSVLLAPSASAYSGANNGPNGTNGIVFPFVGDQTALSAGIAYFMSAIEMVLEAASIGYAGTSAGSAVTVLGWTEK